MMKRISQRDPAWAKQRLGYSSLTVRDFGCTTSCVSMLSDYYGEYLSPLQLAKMPRLYTLTGLILWAYLPFKKFRWVWRQYGRDDKKILESLNDPKLACALQVNNRKHWVVPVSAIAGGRDYWIIDPIDGKRVRLFARYPNITGSSHFARR